jgi:carbonic anhydrase
VPDELLQRLRRFHSHTFPGVQERFQNLVRDGQHPTILFIGCSDSRLVPYLLTGTGPGDLFIVRNVGAFVPPYDGSAGYHGTSAAIEFAVLNLKVSRIVVCGHSHCGGIRALYEEVPPEAKNLAAWLELGREAVLPVQASPEALRRTEQRAVVLQLERLMDYPMVRQQVDAGRLALHGWHYVIEDGEVHVFDVQSGAFVPASDATHSGTGPYHPVDGDIDDPLFNEIDASYGQRATWRAPGSAGTTEAAPQPELKRI